MIKSIKKFTTAFVLAVLAIVLCVCGGLFLRSDSSNYAEAASATTTDVNIVADKTTAAPGDVIKFTVTITSGQPADMHWSAIALVISIFDKSDNLPSIENTKYFELDTSFGDEDAGTSGYKTNAVEWDNDIGDFTYTYYDFCGYVNGATRNTKGFNVSLAESDVYTVPANTPVVVQYALKVKEDCPKLSTCTFGISAVSDNAISFNDSSSSNEIVHQAPGSISSNTVEIKIGKVGTDPSLSKVEAGTGTTLTSVSSASPLPTALNHTVTTTQRTAFKIKPTAKDGTLTEIKYSVGASSDPTSGTTIASGSEATISLDNSGTTVVKFYTTAEDGTSHQTYTLTIVNKYVSLSGFTMDVKRPTGAESLPSGFNTLNPAFAQDTDTVQSDGNFTVKIPSDHTQVQFTPTVAANFGINTSIAVAATGASASSTTVNSGSVLSLTNVTDNATVRFTLTGVDSATKVYTVTFDVQNVDTSISSLTMTSGGNTVSGSTTGTGWSFTLEEEADYKGTFNATLGATTSTLTIGSDPYSPTKEYSVGSSTSTSLTFKVTAEAGNSKTYTVVLNKLIKAGELKDLKFNAGSDAPTAVDNTNSTLTSSTSGGKPNNVYTIKLSYDPAVYSGQDFNITGTPTSGATTSTSSNLTGNGANAWKSSARMTYNNGGVTTYTVTVTSATGVTTYNFEVSLKENKNDITNIVFKQGGKSVVVPFDGGVSFSQSNTTYTINVPFKDYATLDVEVTTDGKYCKVEDGEGTYTTTAGTTSHKRTSISLTPGSPKLLTFTAKSDTGTGSAGTPYTVTITRAAADNDALLQSLEVSVNGVIVPFVEGTFVSGTLIWNVEFDASAITASTVPVVIKAVPNSSKATITSDSNASTSGKTNNFALAKGQEKTASYVIKVQPEDGPTTNYTVNVKNVIPDPEFTDLQISFVNQSAYTSVLSAAEYDSATKTYTVKKIIETDGVPLNSSVFFKGTTTAEATVTAGSGLTQVTANKEWKINNLAYGKTSVQLTVAAKGKTVVYKFDISLLEGKNEITDITLKKDGNNIDATFVFNPSTYTYDLKVPYASFGTGSINIEVTTDGTYTSVVDGTGKTFTSTNTSNKHTSTINCATLTTGSKTAIVLHAVADPTVTPTEVGTPYTINIEKEAADDNADLNLLKLYIDGSEVLFEEGDFNPSTLTYTYTIPSPAAGTTSVSAEIYAIADSAKSKVTGSSNLGAYDSNNTKFSFTYSYPTSTKTDTYQIFVDPESGVAGRKTYKVEIKRVFAKGDLTDVRISYDNSYFQSIFTEFDATTKTYKGKVDIASLPGGVGSDFYIEADATVDSKITTSSNLTLNSGKYVGKLNSFGDKNKFELTAGTSAGNTKYVIEIEVYEDKDAVSDIKVMNGSNALSSDLFTFSEYTDTYTFEVDYTVSSVVIRVKPEGDYETIKADGATVSAKKADGYFEIASGSLGSTAKVIKIYGVANEGRGKTDGTMKGMEYTFNITKAKADANTTLSSLTVKIDGKDYDLLDGAGGNSVTFDPDTNEYWVEFEKWGTATAATVAIEATPTNSTSTVSGLPTGNNNFKYSVKEAHEETYTITVRAQSGATNQYKVHVKRVVLVGDFTTLEIKVPNGDFESVFDSSDYDEYEKIYTLNLKTSEAPVGSQIIVNAVPSSGATTSTDPKLTNSGTRYTIKLEHGSKEYNFTAKSDSGSTTYKFVINLFEEKNEIEKITFKHDKGNIGTETFSFNKNTNSYQFNVANSINSLTMSVVTDGEYAIVKDGDGNTLNKAKVARTHEMTVTLNAGETTTIGVRAVSDTDIEGDTYWIEITRDDADSDTTLKTLFVTVGGKTVPFEESFDPELTDYTVYLEANELGNYSAIISATPNKATTTVTGTGSKQIKFSENPRPVYEIVTTAQNGDTRTYTVTFMQKEPVVVDYIAKVRLNNDKDLAFTVYSDSQAFDVYKAKETVFTGKTVDFNIASAQSGLTYTVGRIVDGNKVETVEPDDENGYTLDLEVGTNVYCAYFSLASGEVKPVVFVMERVNPSLDGLSALEIRQLASDYTSDSDNYSYSVASGIEAITLTVDYDKDLYRCVIEGAEGLAYGMNTITIKLYEKNKTKSDSSEPLRTITLNVYRESNDIFWIVMTAILAVLAVALVIIIILVKRRNNNGGDGGSDEPIIITQSSGSSDGGNQPIVL